MAPGSPDADSDDRVSKAGSLPDKRASDGTFDDVVAVPEFSADGGDQQPFRLYKRRFVGLVGLFLLNIVGGMCWPWFGAIANDTAAEFHVSLDRVNWLGNVFCLVYLPTAMAVPIVCSKYGIRRCCEIGSAFLVVSAWIRYAGTAKSLSVDGAYALLIVGSLLAAVAQPIFQVLGPKYSEAWFNLQGRTTATMVLSLANPIGGAIGQLISPLVGDVRQSILVLGIVCTVIAPAFLLVGSAPPTPPTYSASKRTPPISALLRAWFGLAHEPDAHMSRRERLDLAILVVLFGTLVGATTAFGILTAQYFQPVGYSSDDAGLFGAVLILAGIVAGVVTAPLYDRVFTHHLALTARVLAPLLGAAWLSLIWAVRRDNTGALFAIMAVIGACSLTMLPVGLELGVEITRNAEASSALLWAAGNAVTFMFILAEGALRAGKDANPPLNMHRALIFQGALIFAVCASIFAFRGHQTRRALDAEKATEARIALEQRAPA